MAKVFGKCPHCGEIIPVNDEKETGFCSKCGQQLDVQQSILAYQSLDAAGPAPVQQDQGKATTRSSTAQRRQATPRAANSSQKVREMFQMCSSEQDFLMLRSNVLQMSVSDTEKADLLAALDEATKERLSATLQLAKEYEESKESPMNTILGCILLVVIGFAIQHFFSIGWAGIASIVLAALGIFGTMTDKLDKTKAGQRASAASLIAAYREQGYKI